MAKTTKVKGNKKEAKASKQTKEEKAAAVSSSSSSSSSESESSDSESSSSSSSSDSESEAEVKKEESKSTSSSSDSSDEEEGESKKEESKESSSSDASSSDSESEKEESNDKKRKSEDAEEEEEEDESSNKKQKNEESGEPATIFVGRLSWSIDDEWLKKEFEHIGGVISARVINERGTDRSRGYGYVDFENKSYAEKAIQEMQGKEIDGRPINCDLSTSKPAGNNTNDRAKKFGDTPSEPSDTLFLGNLSFNADRDTIFELFAKHGEVVSVRIPTHPETEQPKGFGYVQFSSLEDSKKALESLQGEYIDNRPVRLDYSSPRPNNDGGRGGSRGFGGRGGARGGNRGFGGRGGARGGARGGRGGFRPTGSGANNAPLGRSRNTASFAGSKKTFD
ncbi:Nsr1p SKDI_07G4090 [Saccharomyces kudriavzevii IFO 1802]|uniref:Uncharacterized protein n=2 Tax=Saccharomyces kudriavzevii (strain ATCC MYA-4449 / AS 2.2408 / CBS 8840 / NBRC 1802 / NCYC 2889) TaxID=226230 RepID=A0AA35NQU3_SACK1|nr:uncharacterized protein SKDI_07G4090 [Saccharomyces kudriavzevii IFO 1802]EJT44580.1 NSR1-like protein [Saccharomyces kudriavzevii IFO 1802]CAI4062627.1 hypothetical protein SKDI_07G4090 [Saccharomyces kudriavzevii IFO 1802]CAI5274414.1 AIS_HP2_G0020340.mRNA.1.CDS.1 [Saccharomyces cerevisiae]CAI6526651.1 AIS_HP2_G0020340.mRNA.1.CDS.1 [Saccharomyces cerevisiae]